MFALFHELVVRLYNVTTPKHRNVHLRPDDTDRWVRNAEAEEPPDEVVTTLERLLAELQQKLAFLEDVAERQLDAALSLAKARAAW